MKTFYIQCESCLENIEVYDGYNNDGDIQIKITGESLVEIKCKSCGSEIVLIDGEI